MHHRALLVAGLLLPASPGAAQPVLKVTKVPAGTPPTDTLFVAGSFNGWNPRNPRFALQKEAGGTYQLRLPAAVGPGPVEYKFTRGSWATVEVDAKNQQLANRKAELSAGPGPEITHQILAWADQSGVGVPSPQHTATPEVQVLATSFVMPQLGRRRRVWIYLPAEYAKNAGRRYPVLYMHDGQNVFDSATSYGGEWGVDETLNRLRQTGQDATGSIVVAVDNGGEFRSDEYIPWPSDSLKGQPHQGGQGGSYVDFLARTLKPYIDAHYRTRPGAAHTGIAGSSLGGLISVYAALKYPKVFGEIGVFSPAFWVCNDSLKAFAKTHPAAPTARFYFVCGPKESKTMLPLMTQWRDELRAQGVPAANLSLHAPADGEHREWFWRREFPAAYRFLFLPAAKAKASTTRH